ncbi:MAG: hypothetical protein ACXAB4_04865 [Candidatus Hodarchaeales archaeon]|jgi:hypothetical protein
MAITTLPDNPNFVYDDSLGIVVPATMLGQGRYIPHPYDNTSRERNIRGKGVVYHKEGVGTILQHDSATGIAFWPAYASGLDDMLMRALVRGYMANSGQTPVQNTLLSTIVTKVQSMVGTWITNVRGRTSPVKKTLDLMARAQDSQFGSAKFVRLFMGALLTDNRGAIGAQVPIESILFDDWDKYGMTAVPIPGQKKKVPELYTLEMTEENFRENQGLWMLDGLGCYPTGNSEYPYWITKHSQELKRDVWVLIHRDYGFQLLQEAAGVINEYPGFGQSGVWRFSPYAVKHMAIDLQDWEHLIHQPMRGVVWVSGLDTPTQFRDQLERYQKDREEEEMYFYPGVFFGGSRGENSKITMSPWSEPPAGYTADGWRNEWVDALAAAFHLNVTHLVIRLGEGAMTQTDVAASLEAETAVAAYKQQIEQIWNYMAPPRTLVTVIWQTDRLKRYQTDTFKELSLGISRVQETVEGELPTFERGEIRALTEEFAGIEIPEMSEEDRIESDKRTGEDIDDVEERYILAHGGRSLPELTEIFDDVYDLGHMVGTKDLSITGEIVDLAGNASSWIWIRTNDGYEMLVDSYRLCLLWTREARQRTRGNYLPNPEIRIGARATTLSGTPCTVREVLEDTAYVNFDWDAPHVSPRAISVHELVYLGFEPEGEPLEPVDEVVIDRDEAQRSAEETWDQIAPEDLKDLI